MKRTLSILLCLLLTLSVITSLPVEAFAAKLSAPRISTIKNVNDGIKIDWNDISKATQYIIYRKAGAQKSWVAVKTVKNSQYTDTAVTSGKTYKYTVRAKNNSNLSTYNKTGSSIKRLSTPTKLKLVNKTAGITFSWSKVTGADSYRIYRKAGNALSWSYVRTLKSNSYTDKNTVSGRNYRYTVRAIYSDTLGAYSQTGVITKRLDTPTNLKATNRPSTIRISWSQVNGANGYRIYRKTQNASAWSYLGATSSTTFTDKKVENNQTYRYTVRAVYNKITGGYSSTGVVIKFISTAYKVNLNSIPAFSGKPFISINNNIPGLSPADRTSTYFEKYSSLDSLGRCGVAFACLGKETMPTGDRGDISSIKPSGWHSVEYDCIDGGYLYNRCHLIGFQLSAENANERNLITGTRFLNVDGMLPFENMVADYIDETGNHVLYRVTPIFKDNELVARGVQMEAYSVEDKGEGICFNVYCYNNQPGITINYQNGSSYENGEDDTDSPSSPSEECDYILNTSSKKFHYPSCRSAATIADHNRQEYTGTRDQLIAMGYSPCGNCDP